MDELPSVKKRKALCNDDNEAKHARTFESSNGGSPMQFEEDNSAVRVISEDNILSSMEDMLVVPIDYIFREVPAGGMSPAAQTSQSTPNAHSSHRQKPLLSRSEAQCFLQINLLAHEMDSLTAISTVALHQRLQWNAFATSLRRTDHPCLRPLLPILHTLHEQVPESTLQKVAFVLNHRIAGELRRNVVQLRQCSEQNWTLAETLQDSVGEMGQVLAEEKRKLSDIQEEVCQRIEYLLLHDNSGSGTSCLLKDEVPASSWSSLRRNGANTMCSMKDYCDRIFQRCTEHQEEHANVDDDNEEILEEPTSTALSSVSSPADSPTQHAAIQADSASASRASTSVSKASTPAAAHKTPIPASAPRTFQPQRLMDSSSKKPAAPSGASEEKENAPSQSSSQHSSSQRTPNGVESVLAAAAAATASAESEEDEDCFRSQGAAEVLSSFAATNRTAAAWEGESPAS